jgi:(1->4)-alpha-D-glucan 1-alpha-D-glucosylmutase
VVVVPRFLTGILPVGDFPLGENFWNDTSVEITAKVSQWDNIIPQTSVEGGESIPVGRILNSFPVALLVGKEDKTE